MSVTEVGSRTVTGGWRPGDPLGPRQLASVGDLSLESGEVLPQVQVAYETWGEFTGDNAVLILHALTGDSHVTGHPSVAGDSGWWSGLVGPGLAIDTDVFYVVAPNILGGCQGTTGPATFHPDGDWWGSRFPELTVRDQVAAEVALADLLGVDRWYAVLGGSAGGMRALEWAIEYRRRVERLLLLACSAAATADQIALSSIQIDLIETDPHFAGGDYYGAVEGPAVGLDLARRIAHVSYRSEPELGTRFGRRRQNELSGEFAVESYLRHHGEKLVQRFDANSYVVLNRAMNSHDVGRGRGGVAVALKRIDALTLVAGIDSDRLYPLRQQIELADGIDGCEALDVVRSVHGHDGFLIETEQVGRLVRELLG